MNSFQIVRQLQSIIRALTWGDASTKVFLEHSVLVSSGPRDGAILDSMSPPYAFILPGAAQIDPRAGEEPDLVQHDFLLRLATVHPADAFGEAVLIGANRTDHQTGPGAGLLEIENVVLAGVDKLTAEDGVRIIITNSSAISSSDLGEAGVAAFRDYTLRCLTTLVRSYRAGTDFAAVDAAGGGDADLTWALPPARYDYRRMILRRAAGSTPPASSTAGTGVTIGGSPDGVSATSVTDSPGAGEFSYALFVAYDDFSSSSDTTSTASGTATVTVT